MGRFISISQELYRIQPPYTNLQYLQLSFPARYYGNDLFAAHSRSQAACREFMNNIHHAPNLKSLIL